MIPWVIVDVDGGLVQDVVISRDGDVFVIVIDFDNMRWRTQDDPDDAVSYALSTLNELRALPPGKTRRSWRRAVIEAVDWARARPL
jgi:hypothetical protein